MKFSTAIVLGAAAMATALPLKKGNTWTWLVTDRAGQPDTWRTATVLDSSIVESGTLWLIAGRDSLAQSQDTGAILQDEYGWQAWWTLSRWLAWEPTPPTASDSFEYTDYFPNHGPYPWGAAFAFIAKGLSRDSQVEWGSNLHSPSPYCSLDQTDVGIGKGVSASCPLETFDSAGVPVRARILESRLLNDRGSEWILLDQRGRPVDSTTQALHVPAPGTRLVWWESDIYQVRTQSYTKSIPKYRTRTWVIGSPTDSGDWTLVPIEESLDSSTASNLVVRWNRMTGARIPAKSTIPDPDESWWASSSDPKGPLDSPRKWEYTSGLCVEGALCSSFSRSWSFRDSSGEMKSLTALTRYSSGSGGSGQFQDSSFTRILLSVDGIQVSPRPDAVHSPAFQRPVPHSLPALAALHPSLPLRWRDVRGRSGQLPASMLAQSPPAAGVLFLEATLPDGSHWRGTLLNPR